MFLFIFQPAAEWDAVLQAKRGLGFIVGIQLLPMMLMASFAEGAGMAGGRKWHAGIHGVKYFTVGEAVVWEMMQLMLMLVVIATCAYLIRLMGETFNSHYPFRQTLILVIYTFSPLFVLRLLDAIPGIAVHCRADGRGTAHLHPMFERPGRANRKPGFLHRCQTAILREWTNDRTCKRLFIFFPSPRLSVKFFPRDSQRHHRSHCHSAR